MTQWRAVVGYEDAYEVSDQGELRSLDRHIPHYTGRVLLRRGRKLRCSVSAKGYVVANLSREGRPKTFALHRIVLEAFRGPRKPAEIVRHLDGDQMNNRLANLAYGTHQDNSDDMARHGRVLKGEKHGAAKLSDADVARMRSLAPSRTYKELAAEFRCSRAQVYNIIKRKQRKD